ncbi:hypothetical protein JKP88DRAFT_232625 [Tribonema minus]|uniref:Uncharacterized protein n=1 Tax=Tribonema minus TaxID=303371 RepID=A0A836CNM9_9STRA|nr:hypothetical protein JKP88DRAFT_232625 [Tribonema minus]
MPAPPQQQRYMVPPQQQREYMQGPPAPAMARQYQQQEPLRTSPSYPDSHHFTQQQQRLVVPPQQQQNFMPQRPSAPQRGAQYHQQGRIQAPPQPQWEQQRHQQHARGAILASALLSAGTAPVALLTAQPLFQYILPPFQFIRQLTLKCNFKGKDGRAHQKSPFSKSDQHSRNRAIQMTVNLP